MAAKGNAFINDLLKLIFNATAIANVADNAASAPLASLYLSLHTASPGPTGTQNTNECAFPSYGRIAVARTTGGWTASSVQVTNLVADKDFVASTGSPSEVITHFGIGVAVSGPTKLLYYGTVTPNITMNAAGITCRLTTVTNVTES